jgi:DNA-binding MarR family transcriptional regulator
VTQTRKSSATPVLAADDHARDVLDCIRRIEQVIRVASRRSERAVGLSAAQLFILEKLADSKAVSLNELARRTATHQSSASVVVAKLVDGGLVERNRSRRDKRKHELSLTGRGRSLLRRAPGAAQKQLMAALAGMRPARVKQLATLLNEFVENLDTGDRRDGRRRMFDTDGN